MFILLNREINNCWIFIHKESVLGESLDVQDNELWQSRYFESLHMAILI